ncbi:MFS transporter [Chloroflexota bacterium]
MATEQIGQSPEAKPRFFYGYIVVIAACFIMLLSLGTYFSFGVFLKPMLTHFGWTSAMTSGALSLSWVVQGIVGIVMGKLNDRFGPRFVLTISGFLLGLGYLLTSQTTTLWQLYLFYGVMVGAGIGGIVISLLSTTARWFVNKRSMMTAIVAAGGGMGVLVAPPIVSRLISSHDWRTAYAILGIVVLVLIVSVAQLMKLGSSQVGKRQYGETGAHEEPVLQAQVFSIAEAVSTRQFWVISILLFSFGYCTQAVMAHIVLHSMELGISLFSAANILAAIGGISIIGRIVVGGAADRIGNRQTFIIALILIVVSLFWLVLATDVWMLYLFVAVFGIPRGAGALVSPLVAELFGLRSHGMILGVVALGYTFGSALGPFLTGHIFDVSGSYRLAFTVCAAIAILGVVWALLLRPNIKR